MPAKDEPGIDPATTERVTDPDYGASIEPIFRPRLVAFDWNCPQHALPRFSAHEIATAAQPLHDRLAALERKMPSYASNWHGGATDIASVPVGGRAVRGQP